MGLFDGLDDIEKIGGLEAPNEQLKKDVVKITMDDYTRVVYGITEKNDVTSSKLFRRLFDGFIEE